MKNPLGTRRLSIFLSPMIKWSPDLQKGPVWPHDAAADPAFPASPPVQRHDKPALYAPFGNGAVLSLLAANTSRIITPWLPSRIEPHEPKPLTPASTPPITCPPGAAELSGHANKSRAEAYAAHA